MQFDGGCEPILGAQRGEASLVRVSGFGLKWIEEPIARDVLGYVELSEEFADAELISPAEASRIPGYFVTTEERCNQVLPN